MTRPQGASANSLAGASASGATARVDRLGGWCGWIVLGALALAPAMGWLGPMGFPILVGGVGLLTLPALRITDVDRPVAVALLAGLLWAAASSTWSPYRPGSFGHNTLAKLALQLPLYWAALCAARRAEPRLKRRALAVFAVGVALFGLVLLLEFATDAGLYERLHVAFYEPIRHDLAEVSMGHSSFVLAIFWPLALAAAWKARITGWVALPMTAGALAAALRFGSDAPVIAVPMAAVIGLAAWRWPSGAPRTLAVAAALYWLLAPAIIALAHATGRYDAFERVIPRSWSMRMDFWTHAVDWLKDHPLRGWGLDASRVFGPGIILHPHDDALQVWLELGAVGAVLAAAVWFLSLRRLARPLSNLGGAAATASAAVYLLFAAVNFGVWQEWWLAMAALIAIVTALLIEPDPGRRSTETPILR